jgi:hypothetical protein
MTSRRSRDASDATGSSSGSFYIPTREKLMLSSRPPAKILPLETRRKWKYLRDKHSNPYQPREAWLRPARGLKDRAAYLFGMHWGTKRHYTLVAP